MLDAFSTKKSRNAYQLFYPLAALWAALSVVLWIAQYIGYADFALSAQDHAHEMIFGFALAVMTGFLLNGVTPLNLTILAGLWIIGRIILFIPLSSPMVTGTIHLAYPLLLATLAAYPLFKNAKSWRNLTFAPILSAFIIAEVLFQSGRLGFLMTGEERGLFLGLNLICAMVYMMGGRVVTAVTNGYLQSFEDRLKPGAQSYWEEKGFFALLCLVLGDMSGFTPLSVIGALALSFCLGMRIYHWQVAKTAHNPQCLWLHIGFIWLLVGLILRSVGYVTEGPWTILGIHAITIAALGTLTLTIMSRTTLQRLRRPITWPFALSLALIALNISVATRLLMVLLPEVPLWAIVSAASFCLGFGIFTIWAALEIRHHKK